MLVSRCGECFELSVAWTASFVHLTFAKYAGCLVTLGACADITLDLACFDVFGTRRVVAVGLVGVAKFFELVGEGGLDSCVKKMLVLLIDGNVMATAARWEEVPVPK